MNIIRLSIFISVIILSFVQLLIGRGDKTHYLATTNLNFGVIASYNLEDFNGLNEILTSDYNDLSTFSDDIKNFNITPAKFNGLCWNGLVKSLRFYLSAESINPSSINHIIKKELWGNSDLRHPLGKPEISNCDATLAFKALDQFSGKWHGLWQSSEVHHLWLPIRKYQKEITDGYSLIGFQSCFTGDGIGWNYIVKNKKEVVILGFVYHYDKNGEITAKNPHFAFLNTYNQLTWISDTHIYHEFVCGNANCKENKHYVITGADYKRHSKKIEITSGFQAVYCSENLDLPTFKDFVIHKLDNKKKVFLKKLVLSLKASIILLMHECPLESYL